VRKASFPPVVGPNTRVLILGSLPGEASLARGQYYGHPRNQFWRLVADMIGVPDLPALDYPDRLGHLLSARVGLWDVIASAVRRGSLDGAIRDHEPNALADLIASLPALRAIGFNGQTAAALGRRALGPAVAPVQIVLPSSSPAYTLAVAEKARAWRQLADYLGVPPAQGPTISR
jgi:TDG/mug DNA glycosylase family protein